MVQRQEKGKDVDHSLINKEKTPLLIPKNEKVDPSTNKKTASTWKRQPGKEKQSRSEMGPIIRKRKDHDMMNEESQRMENMAQSDITSKNDVRTAPAAKQPRRTL